MQLTEKFLEVIEDVKRTHHKKMIMWVTTKEIIGIKLIRTNFDNYDKNLKVPKCI